MQNLCSIFCWKSIDIRTGVRYNADIEQMFVTRKRGHFMRINNINRNRNKRIVMVAIVVVLLATVVTPIVNASTSKPARTMYVKSIKIQEGDSLWSIATEYYTEEYASIQEYINEIKSSNNLYEDTIHTGNFLIIPYYS